MSSSHWNLNQYYPGGHDGSAIRHHTELAFLSIPPVVRRSCVQSLLESFSISTPWGRSTSPNKIEISSSRFYPRSTLSPVPHHTGLDLGLKCFLWIEEITLTLTISSQQEKITVETSHNVLLFARRNPNISGRSPFSVLLPVLAVYFCRLRL